MLCLYWTKSLKQHLNNRISSEHHDGILCHSHQFILVKKVFIPSSALKLTINFYTQHFFWDINISVTFLDQLKKWYEFHLLCGGLLWWFRWRGFKDVWLLNSRKRNLAKCILICREFNARNLLSVNFGHWNNDVEISCVRFLLITCLCHYLLKKMIRICNLQPLEMFHIVPRFSWHHYGIKKIV